MSEKRIISITEALKELKLYESKITKAIGQNTFVGAKKKSADRVGVVATDRFCELAKSGYQSINDLIENRDKIKAAIVQSNAITTVEINGVEYTVAQAIEFKNSSIRYKKLLLSALKEQYAEAVEIMTRENVRVDRQVDKMLETFVGKDSDKKINETDMAAISEPYRAKNEYEIVDPISIRGEIDRLEAEIDGFEAEVDVKLSISNSITHIEI